MKPVNQTMEKAGLRRLENRAKRLLRLLELAAPKPIIAGAVALILQAIEVYAPEEYFKALSEEARKRWKRDMRYCATDDCKNILLQNGNEEYCPDCWKMLKEEAGEDDAEPLVADIERDPDYECEGCGKDACIEIVFKDKRCWACESCHPVLMARLGPGARSASIPTTEN